MTATTNLPTEGVRVGDAAMLETPKVHKPWYMTPWIMEQRLSQSDPAQALERARVASRLPWFDMLKFLDEIENSKLNAGTRRTMIYTAGHADIRGIVRESNESISETLGCRQATISDHWKKARNAGYLLTKRRYNAASVQQLTWPSGNHVEPDLIDTFSSPLQPVEWSPPQRQWFGSAREGVERETPPWGEDQPPF